MKGPRYRNTKQIKNIKLQRSDVDKKRLDAIANHPGIQIISLPAKSLERKRAKQEHYTACCLFRHGTLRDES
jgi:hypothetical protein